ncbi:hypothetical protein [Foetidibacter luteolus]|uniref:hypothetical protein n=1 Tax=Foetidibacter luteolus TaxID=2608880 RepID=UPI00129BC99D|nr:hypothetical protein [Foetidibacter luteolus]
MLSLSRTLFFICLALVPVLSFCQADSLPVEAVSAKTLSSINSKYAGLTSSVDKQSSKLLRRLQKQEEKLRKKLAAKDSAKAAVLFSGTQEQYRQLQNKLQAPLDKSIPNPLKEYMPNFDSLGTAMNYLEKIPGLPSDQLKKVAAVSNQLKELQGKLQKASEIKDFIRQRQQQLQDQLSQYSDLAKNLKGLNKEVFYYSERLKEYRELIKDRKKLEEKAIAAIREIPAFKSFFLKNSYLSQLFRLPGSSLPFVGGAGGGLAGLQTRAQVQQQLQRVLGSSLPSVGGAGGGTGAGGAAAGGGPGQMLQQQVQAAQGQLNQLKDKLAKPGGGGNSDDIQPDFKKNDQRTKSFLKRIEYGINLQTSGSTNFSPTTTDIALTLGYRFSSDISAGFGIAHKMGLGRGWNHISLSHQGIGFRSYCDARIKGSFWLSAGLEYNYLKEFENFRQIKNLDIYQKSALAGITKKYRIGKKKEGKMQLLYDALHQLQTPRGQALKFRVGWTL